MASHGPHPSILEHGLADGCDRCAEIALDPFAGLDDTNLRELVERLRFQYDVRSALEATAMSRVEEVIRKYRQLERLGVFQ